MTQAPPREQRLSVLFSALSDPTRRAFVARLAEGEASVTELSELVDISLPAVSRHLRLLDDAGLVARRKRGRITWCRLEPGALELARDWLEDTRRAWEDRLDRLAAWLEEE